MTRRLTTEQFIEKAKAVHGEKFDYSQAQYQGTAIKITIICPEHGSFQQTPNTHLSGSGCPQCKGRAIARARTYTPDEFLRKAREKYGSQYDLSQTHYVNSLTPITVVCPEHGPFQKRPNKFLFGQGCPVCAKQKNSKSRTVSEAQFLKRARKAHGDRYTYRNYKAIKQLVEIRCLEHGWFTQEAKNHAGGQGCPQCWEKRRGQAAVVCVEDFLSRSTQTHRHRYLYDLTSYSRAAGMVRVWCPDHGWFEQMARDHMAEHGCRACAGFGPSVAENEIAQFVESLGLRVERHRRILQGREIDIYLPEVQIGIEYNGLVHHSERFHHGQHDHQQKTDWAAEQGIRLIHVFQHTWEKHPEAVKSLLAAACGKISRRLNARSCRLCIPSAQQSRQFLDRSHVQGYVPSTHYLGLQYRGELVAVATFRAGKSGQMELARYAALPFLLVRGGLGRLVAAWRRQHPQEALYTFCDTTCFTGKSYAQIGFEEIGELAPDYFYTYKNGFRVLSKEAMRKDRQKRYFSSFDPEKTERQNAWDNGWYRVWGCRKVKYGLGPLLPAEARHPSGRGLPVGGPAGAAELDGEAS